jgi:hypothetical protein
LVNVKIKMVIIIVLKLDYKGRPREKLGSQIKLTIDPS